MSEKTVEYQMPARLGKKPQDFTGQRFGRWTVLSFLGKRGKIPYWECRCDCGTVKPVCSWTLTRGTSPGCHRCGHGGDLVGQRFGRLLVLRRGASREYVASAPARWYCICDCGQERLVDAQALRTGATQSCGCLHRDRVAVDLTGQRFGRLVVITRSGQLSHNGGYRWICMCDCGCLKEIHGGHLQDGNVKSCGCISRTRDGQSRSKTFRNFYSRNRRDRERDLDQGWTVEMEQALCEFQLACVVCEAREQLSTDHVRPLSKGHGLKPSNAVRLCLTCNSCKQGRMPRSLPKHVKLKILKAAGAFFVHWNQLVKE